MSITEILRYLRVAATVVAAMVAFGGLHTKHAFLHTSLIESDARLMWRTAWYPVEGIASREYDLTLGKGTRGVTKHLCDEVECQSEVVLIHAAAAVDDQANPGTTATRVGRITPKLARRLFKGPEDGLREQDSRRSSSAGCLARTRSTFPLALNESVAASVTSAEATIGCANSEFAILAGDGISNS